MSSTEPDVSSYRLLLNTKAIQNKMRGNKKGVFSEGERTNALYDLVCGLSYQSNGDKNKSFKIMGNAVELQTKFETPLPEEIFSDTFDSALLDGSIARKKTEVKETASAPETNGAMDVIKDSMAAKNDTLPSYVYEIVDDDDTPTGKYAIDFKKYSDFLHNKFNSINFKNMIYIYDESMFMHKQDINEIHTHARDTYIKYNITGQLQGVLRETDSHIKSMGNEGDYPFSGTVGVLNVSNGIVDLSNGNLLPHNPRTLFDYIISTPYKTFKETPELDNFLAQYGNQEVVSVLAKALWQRGYVDTLKEITVFFGDKDCGKTTAAELIQSTIDGDLNSKRNTSRTLLNDMLQRFGYAGMENKLINIGDDLPDMFVKNTGRINELVGSVHHDIEKKGVDRYHGIVTAYHLFTTNNLPPLDDDDMVIWSKIRLVEFKNTFVRGTVREGLYTDIVKEQLLYRAIELLRGWKQKHYANDQSAEEVRRIWHEASSDVEMFAVECIVVDTVQFVKLDVIRDHYERWCAVNGKRRHMKHLTKYLQRYAIRRSDGNGYMISLAQIREPIKKQGETLQTG